MWIRKQVHGFPLQTEAQLVDLGVPKDRGMQTPPAGRFCPTHRGPVCRTFHWRHFDTHRLLRQLNTAAKTARELTGRCVMTLDQLRVS